MAAPTHYALAYDFTSFQSSNPTTPLPADKLEIEFNALQTTTDELIPNLGAIQRSDNALANNSVGNDQLKSEVTIGVNPAADWVTGTEYEANDTVYESNKVYRCLLAHTAGVFATDLAAVKWSEILDFDQFITATEGDLVAVEADNTAIEADLASVESDLSAVESDAGAVETDLSAMEADLAAITGDTAAVEADLSSVESDLSATEGDATAAAADLVSVESDLGAVETDLGSVETDLSSVESDLSATEGDATTTEADATTTEADVTAVEADLSAVESDRAAVEAGLSGKTVQVVNTQTGAVATGTTSIPDDDTIPQITEGDEYMTLAITPTNTNNKLKIDVVFQGTINGIDYLSVALFQDSTADALAAVQGFEGANEGRVRSFTHYMAAGTTSSTTFKVRAGGVGDTLTFNGRAAGRKMGGVMASSITITEIEA